MIRAMELKNLSANTQRTYLTAVTGLAKHYQKSPDELSKEMIVRNIEICWLINLLAAFIRCCDSIGHYQNYL